MIDKREILDAATTFGLNPHVIEKDYVLGWLLWGISNHESLSATWIFKGGTCLKKCFFIECGLSSGIATNDILSRIRIWNGCRCCPAGSPSLTGSGRSR